MDLNKMPRSNDETKIAMRVGDAQAAAQMRLRAKQPLLDLQAEFAARARSEQK